MQVHVGLKLTFSNEFPLGRFAQLIQQVHVYPILTVWKNVALLQSKA